MSSLNTSNTPAVIEVPPSLTGNLFHIFLDRLFENPGLPCYQFHAFPDTIDEVVFVCEYNGEEYLLIHRRKQSRPCVHLSPRELAIAQLIAKGYSNKCIADILEISTWTVASHLRRIFEKLDVVTRAQMIARISEEHLI